MSIFIKRFKLSKYLCEISAFFIRGISLNKAIEMNEEMNLENNLFKLRSKLVQLNETSHILQLSYR